MNDIKMLNQEFERLKKQWEWIKVKLSVSRNSSLFLEYSAPELDIHDSYEVFIGRSDDCHILLDDQSISRHHAVVKYHEGAWKLEKLSEMGELVINGVGSDKHELRQGDLVQISDFIIKVNVLQEVQKEKDENLDSAFEDAMGSELEDAVSSDEFEDNAGDEEVDLENNNNTEEYDTNQTAELDINDDGDVDSENVDLDFNDEPSTGENDDSGSEGDESSGEEGFSDNPEFDDALEHDEDVAFGGENENNATQVFSSFASFSLNIFGEFAPYDRYKIEENEVFIGREEGKCHIMLNDPEVSTIHAKIKKSLVNCVIEDLNSSNGTIVNGERINKHELLNGDEVVIGSTSFIVEISSDLLDSESDILMPVDEDQMIEVEEEVEEEVDFGELDTEFGEEEVEETSILKNPEKRKKLIYGIVGVGLLFALFYEDKPKSTTKEGEVVRKDSKVNAATEVSKKNPKKVLSEEERRQAEQAYQLGKKYYFDGNYGEALFELRKVDRIDKKYTEGLQTLLSDTKEALLKLERREKELREIEEKRIRNLKIKKLIEKARVSVEKRETIIAQSLFSEVLILDPENIEIPRLKLEIEAYEQEIERKKAEIARKKARKQRMEESIKESRMKYHAKEWFRAIYEIEFFLKKKDIEIEYIKEGQEMLKEARRALKVEIDPKLGKARSLKEAQDLKAAYAAYIEVTNVDPINTEALSEIVDIKDILNRRSMKIYRQALIAESLSLFQEAKQKFQEVQQISPKDSEYYIKASQRLKEYIE
jgi:pSer/pThr/pTyr-binding forkhead associated (FHA) protein